MFRPNGNLNVKKQIFTGKLTYRLTDLKVLKNHLVWCNEKYRKEKKP